MALAASEEARVADLLRHHGDLQQQLVAISLHKVTDRAELPAAPTSTSPPVVGVAASNGNPLPAAGLARSRSSPSGSEDDLWAAGDGEAADGDPDSGDGDGPAGGLLRGVGGFFRRLAHPRGNADRAAPQSGGGRSAQQQQPQQPHHLQQSQSQQMAHAQSNFIAL
jgi:hypothetical protein